jgi:hypothetical protein
MTKVDRERWKANALRQLLRRTEEEMGRRAVDSTDLKYFRTGGQGSARIRYHRVDIRRPGKRLGAKMRREIVLIAYMICTLAPDDAKTILKLPSRRVGRMLKAALQRSQKSGCRRRSRRRRTVGVLRVRAEDFTNGRV